VRLVPHTRSLDRVHVVAVPPRAPAVVVVALVIRRPCCCEPVSSSR